MRGRELARRRALSLARVRHHGPLSLQRVERRLRRPRTAPARQQGGPGSGSDVEGSSPNPEGKLQKRPSGLPLQSTDACKSLLAGCAALCAALGLRRRSAPETSPPRPRRRSAAQLRRWASAPPWKP
ncbi:uncharacterized protein [Choristoneura fumiferana]|uniref:uncharacterized protein n=1 Tax=Choristoneura fumiferana TaxID=7141 RepID=UPI003D15A776